MNKTILIGRCVRDPELKYTQSGTAVASFTLAVSRSFKNSKGEYEADFINCVAWNKSGEFVANYFKKGQLMALEGRLQVRTYDDKDGQKRWVTEVVAENVEFVGPKDNNGTGGGNNQTGNGQSHQGGLGLGEEIEFDPNELPF